MAAGSKKTQRRYEQRLRDFDATMSKTKGNKGGYKRPGSMNKRKAH